MIRFLRQVLTSPPFQWLRRLWPQAPLGLFLSFVGALNVLIGLQSRSFSPMYQIMPRVLTSSALGQELAALSQQVSLGILGSGVQVLLGVGMFFTGIGLFWRLRSAWAFTILLVLTTIAVNLISQHSLHHALLPGLALAALVIWQDRFSHRSLFGNYLMSLIGFLSVLGYGTLGALLLGSNFAPSIRDLNTALYFTVVTLSTVGSNIYPTTPEGKLFMVTLIVGGISIFTTTIVTTLGPLLSDQIKPLLSGNGVNMELGNHVILVGASSVTSNVALDLASRGVAFVQVIAPEDEPPPSRQPAVRGDPSDDQVLKKAGILSARTIVVAGEDDATNAFISLAAKNLNPRVRVIVVAGSSQAIPRLKLARADLVFAPSVVGARLLTNLIKGDPIPQEFQDLFQDS